MSIPSQLLAAMKQRDWTVGRLLKESGLSCHRTSLMRKLKGEQTLTADEIQSLVNALGVTVAAVPSEPQ